MNNQELFDRVVDHLAAQKRPCVAGGLCRYRYRDLKCAYGCLIPDHLYRDEFEGNDLYTGDPFIVRELLAAGGVEKKQKDLVIGLQQSHDNSDSADMLKLLLDKVAARFDLDSGRTALITEWKVR